jgi:hypothetical protein
MHREPKPKNFEDRANGGENRIASRPPFGAALQVSSAHGCYSAGSPLGRGTRR